jgi:hypothetical protein
MLGFAPARPYLSSFTGNIETAAARIREDHWSQLAISTIFVVGSPRSGTTWLAQVFDSHPTILYRHEPDELSPARPGQEPAVQIADWLRQRGLRAAAKRPHFRKSWRPLPLAVARQTIRAALATMERLIPSNGIVLPDMVSPYRWRFVRAAIKLVNWDVTHVARTLPDTRCILILRHPCGQIASMMAGIAAYQSSRLGTASKVPIDLTAAAACASREGVDAERFAALPYAARLAWNWLAFNEPAVQGVRDLPNARIVIYEDLCRRPEAVARDLFDFAGLDWNVNTAAFLSSSTHNDRPAGYYDVFRETVLVADRWRQSMSSADQEAVRSVVSTSALSACWPDLAAPKA